MNDIEYDFSKKVMKNITLVAHWKTNETSNQKSYNNSLDNVFEKPVVSLNNMKPVITSINFDKSSNMIKVFVVASDHETKKQNLRFKYSINGIKYQSSNIFTNLKQNREYNIYVKVTDEDGNSTISKKLCKTNKISAPIISDINITEMTNQNVVITFNDDNFSL